MTAVEPRTTTNQPDPDRIPLELLEPPSSNGSGRKTQPKVEDSKAPIPGDLEAEQALLGAAMLGATDTLAAVPPAAFQSPAHGHIARAIQRLTAAGQPTDAVTIADELQARHLLDEAGGRVRLAECMNRTPAASAAPRYAEIVLRHHRARQLLHVAHELDQAARQHGPGPALVQLQAHLDTLAELTINTGADPDLDEFLAEVDDDYDWLIPGLLEHRDRVILTATEGGGKSTLLRQIAVQMACGLHPFTGDRIPSQRTLYIDCENTARQARRALRGLRSTAGDDYQPGHLRVRALGHAIALADPEIEADIASRIRRYESDVVIIGPLYKLTSGDPIKEEPAKAVADAIDRLRNIRGSAFLIEAHSPYPEGTGKKRVIRPYGASLWSRWPEFGLHLADDGKIMHWRGERETRDWPAALERSQPWPWMVVTTTESDHWDGPTECAEAITTLLRELESELSVTQIGKRLRERQLSYRDKTISEAAALAHRNGALDCRTGPRGSLLYSSTNESVRLLGEEF